MKKFLSIIIVSMLLVGMVGCKNDTSDSKNYNSGISKVDTSNSEESDIENNNDDLIKCPDFVGMTVAEIEDHDYYKNSVMRFTFEHMESDQYNVSQICEQSIKPDSTVKKGTVITLFISKGQSKIVIPNVYLMDEDEAVNVIRGKGFKTKIELISDNNIEAGKVIKTSPEIGETVTNDQTITIYVSSGAPNVYNSVPDVIGLTRPVAISKLETSGFTVTTVMDTNDNYDYGFVFDTNPVPGTNLAEGGLVTIYVSLGKAEDKSSD